MIVTVSLISEEFTVNRILRSSVAFVAAMVLLALATACHGTDTTAPISSNSGSVDGTWTGATSAYTALRIELVERADDHQLFGRWTGARANCSAKACVDSGIVFSGSHASATVSIGLTALNAARSMAIDGAFNGTIIAGHAVLTDNGTHAPSEALTLTR